MLLQRELESLRAASPRARSLPRAIYGAAALARIDLIRSHAISPHRRKPAYEVFHQPGPHHPSLNTWYPVQCWLLGVHLKADRRCCGRTR